jgi:proteic killer suppression protein
VGKIDRILQRLDAIDSAVEMDLPGYRLHALSGNLKGFWSITVNGNWRVIFRMDGSDVVDVDLVDYH